MKCCSHCMNDIPLAASQCPHCGTQAEVATGKMTFGIVGFEKVLGHESIDADPRWVKIKVSAVIVTWPALCACCNGPNNTTFQVQHTRTDGKRFETAGWDVPYCKRCLRHIDGVEELKGLRNQVERAERNLAWTGPGIILAGMATALLTDFLVIGGMSKVFFIAILLALLLNVPLVLGFYYLYFWGIAQAEKRRREAVAEYVEAKEALQGLFRKGCCPNGQAVYYDGWYGHVHTFRFFNRKYAQEFVEANGRKVLD